MDERRRFNPRMVNSQSITLIHLATSAPTPAQVEVFIYDQILFELPLGHLEWREPHVGRPACTVFRGIWSKNRKTPTRLDAHPTRGTES